MTDFPANAENEALLDEILEVYQPLTRQPLTREDAREIKVNLAGFLRVLMDWDRAAQMKAARGDTAAAGSPEPERGDDPDPEEPG